MEQTHDSGGSSHSKQTHPQLSKPAFNICPDQLQVTDCSTNNSSGQSTLNYQHYRKSIAPATQSMATYRKSSSKNKRKITDFTQLPVTRMESSKVLEKNLPLEVNNQQSHQIHVLTSSFINLHVKLLILQQS